MWQAIDQSRVDMREVNRRTWKRKVCSKDNDSLTH